MHIAADIERMGDLAKHVPKTGLRRHPFRAVPDELAPIIADMAAVADCADHAVNAGHQMYFFITGEPLP